MSNEIREIIIIDLSGAPGDVTESLKNGNLKSINKCMPDLKLAINNQNYEAASLIKDKEKEIIKIICEEYKQEGFYTKIAYSHKKLVIFRTKDPELLKVSDYLD